MRRVLSLPAGRPYTFSGEVLPKDGLALEKLLANPFAISASASSRAVSAPEGRPGAAVDANLTTGWVASGLDHSPSLRLSWPRARRVSGIQLVNERYLAASRPAAVTVELDSGEVMTGTVDDQGYLRFPARSTRTLDIGFTKVTPVTSFDRATGLQQTLPVGVSEVSVLGADDLRKPVNPAQQTGVPCGFGPTLMVDGRPILTRVEGTMLDLLQRRPLRWAACGSNVAGEREAGTVALAAGAHVIGAGATGEFAPLQMFFTTPRAVAGESSAPVAASLLRSDPGTMRITVGQRTQESVVTVAQNYNEGWTARDGQGAVLASIRLDGWKQGWVLPAGTATVVTAGFTPDSSYRGGLLGGLLALLCAAALVPLSRRRLVGWAGRRVPGWARTPAAVVIRGEEREVPGEARIPVAVVICGGALALALMSGWAGVLAGLVACLVVLGLSGALPGLRRWSGAYLPTLIMVLGLTAGLLAASQPWLQGSAGLHSGAVQGLTLLAFALACAAALRDEPSVGVVSGDGERSKWRSRRPRRMMGRSTRR
jgi:arabinofuranan 3-O-arabinosyltransferase